jgi:hypothetical protein
MICVQIIQTAGECGKETFIAIEEYDSPNQRIQMGCVWIAPEQLESVVEELLRLRQQIHFPPT